MVVNQPLKMAARAARNARCRLDTQRRVGSAALAGGEGSNTIMKSRSAMGRFRTVPLREKTLWQMLYETAARTAEILALDVEDLDRT